MTETGSVPKPADPAPAPPAFTTAVAHAMELHRSGRLGEAERAYRAILQANPDHVDALHFMGLLLDQAGFHKEAIEFVERSVDLCPSYADALSNLGNLLRTQGRLNDAFDAYQRATLANPLHAQAFNNLGVALKDLQRPEEAIQAFKKAIALDPSRGDAHHNLAGLLERKGLEAEAASEYRRAIAVQPALLDTYEGLSRALCNLGRKDEAAAVLQELLRKVPDNPVAPFLLAACTGVDTPPKASEGYITQHFNAFADVFDQVLKDIDYRAPSLVASLVSASWPVPEPRFDVLDAGCGTGLCASLLKPYARHLLGVDLSPRMLAKAARLGLYDSLVTAELTQFLGGHCQAFDLIVSADTLVYFGDLAPVLAAAANALRPSGFLVFSLEDACQALPAGFQLQIHGRYCHTEDYARRILCQAGFARCTVDHDILRTERGKPIQGLLIAAFKK